MIKNIASIYEVSVKINPEEIDNKDHNKIIEKELEKNNYWDTCKPGDFILNLSEDQTFCNAYYMVYERLNDEDVVIVKFIDRLGIYPEDYGSIDGELIALGPSYPVGYW